MDCMEAKALKSSLRGELALKSTHAQTWFDDFLCVTAGFACMPNEDFSVDELLDFSNEELQVDDDDNNNHNNNNGFLVGDVDKDDNSLEEDDESSNSGSFFAAGDRDSCPLPAEELSVPDDCLAELEWVSQFVDDSPSELSLLCPVSKEVMKVHENRAETVSGPSLARPLYLTSWGLVKSRSKRPRSSNRVWAIGSPVSSSGSTGSGKVLGYPVQFLGEPPVKKAKKRVVVQGAAVQFQRRCNHCGVQKTPQWRTGPLGPKTLCNACGVRFKSGRLYPEYRPACSPTFCSDIHSNSHRKVVEMRKKKELPGGVEAGLSLMVRSF